MDVRAVTLEGRHVRLEPLEDRHAKDLWASASEHDIWTYMGTHVARLPDLEAWIAARRAGLRDLTALPFLMRDVHTGKAFGSTSLFEIDPENRSVEVGHTWIGRTHRRTIANTEVKFLMLRHAFEALGARRVQMKCDVRNVRSRQAMERIGAVYEGTLRRHRILPDGTGRDTALYSIIDTEWPDVKAWLLRALARAPPSGHAKPPAAAAAGTTLRHARMGRPEGALPRRTHRPDPEP